MTLAQSSVPIINKEKDLCTEFIKQELPTGPRFDGNASVESETAMLMGQVGSFSEILLEGFNKNLIVLKCHSQPEIPQPVINLTTTFL